MNSYFIPIGLLLGTSAAMAAFLPSGNGSLTTQPLPPCSASGTVFQSLGDAQGMSDFYHKQVGLVVDAHVNATNISNAELVCDAENYRQLVPPTEALQSLASLLPHRTAEISYTDSASVLLEFLRVYECSLMERQYFLPVVLQQSDRGKYEEATTNESNFIQHELRTARTSLERTLVVMGGLDRLRPLMAETECIKRSTLDLRNTLGLVAESMSCMPRTYDARGSLVESPPTP